MKKTDYVVLTLFCTYIIFLPLVPSFKSEWILTGTILLIGLIYIFELIFDRSQLYKFISKVKVMVKEPFTYIFLGFLVFMIISVAFSDNKMSSGKETLRFVYYFALYMLIRFRLDSQKYFIIIMKAFLLGSFLVSFIGLTQFLMSYKPGSSLDDILFLYRGKSTLGHPNTLGAYVILAIFPAILIALKTKGIKKIWYILLSIILSINLAISFSRNAWLAFAIGILLLIIIYNWKFVLLSVIPFLYVLFSPKIFSRAKQILDEASNEGRFKLWKLAEKMINDHLFTGVGSGNFTNAYNEYVDKYPQLKVSEGHALPPHNSYIRVFAENGVFGALIFMVFCFDILKKLYAIKDKCKGFVNYFLSGYLVSLMCFYIMNCFDDLFYVPKVATNFFVFMSLIYAIHAAEKNKNKKDEDNEEYIKN